MHITTDSNAGKVMEKARGLAFATFHHAMGAFVGSGAYSAECTRCGDTIHVNREPNGVKWGARGTALTTLCSGIVDHARFDAALTGIPA
jgi:hypothetical protein